MTRRELLLTCCLLVSTMSAFAQARGARADPLSGTWAGELSPSGGPAPVAVTLELKFDGKSAVSGTMTGLPNPGDVKTGSFDPKTGALKLELGITGESAVLIVLEGTLVKDAITGRISGEAGTGEFKIARKR
jgi:hypothetical protein